MWSRLRYPILHWLLTIALGPVLFVFTPAILADENTLSGALEFLLIIMAYGFIFSLPTLVVYVFVYGWITTQGFSTWLTKALLVLVVLVCMAASMALVGGYIMPYLFAYYALAAITSGLLVRPR